MQFQSHRHQWQQFVQFGFHVLARLHHVPLRVGGDADADGTFAVHVHDIGWRVHVPFFDGGDIAQFHLSGFGGNHLVADIVYGGIHTVGSHPELLLAGTDFSGIDNLVLRLQQTGKLFRVDAHTYELIGGNKNIDHLRLRPEQGDFHHPVRRHYLCLDSFRPVSHFFIRETVVTHQAVIDAENVSKIIRDGRYRRACGQLGLYVEHFTPQFVPLLRNGCGRE